MSEGSSKTDYVYTALKQARGYARTPSPLKPSFWLSTPGEGAPPNLLKGMGFRAEVVR
jgi:hypothetical protein